MVSRQQVTPHATADLVRCQVGALEEFGSALSSKYGNNAVFALNEKDAWARLDVQMHGPFDMAVAYGHGVQWTRTVDQLNEDWVDHIFLVYQKLGEARLDHRGGDVILKQDAFALVSPYGNCTVKIVNDGALECMALPIGGSAMAYQKDSCFASVIDSGRGRGRTLKSVYQSLCSGDIYDDLDKSVLIDVFSSLLSYRSSSSDIDVLSPREARALMTLEAWLQENICQPGVSPATLADVMAVSRRQLYRLFEKLGTTPAGWLSHARLQAARETLLSNPHRTITDVAFSAGFNDSAHFSRVYRKRYGQSPRATRALVSNGASH